MFTNVSALRMHKRAPRSSLMQEFPSASLCAIYGCKVGAVHETMLMLASDWLRGKLTFFFCGTLKSDFEVTKWRTRVAEELTFVELKAFLKRNTRAFVELTMQGCERYITEPDGIHYALRGLQSRDFQKRRHNLELVCDRTRKLATDGQSELLKAYLPIILRLAHVCPFEDVRSKCTELLKELKVGANENRIG